MSNDTETTNKPLRSEEAGRGLSPYCLLPEVPDIALHEILRAHYRGDDSLEKLIAKAGSPNQIFS